MKYAYSTDIGKRIHNEDCCCVPDEGAEYQFVAVADGMGGHAAGAVASKLAIDEMQKALAECREENRAADELRLALAAANSAVYKASEEQEAYRGMGTTLVCAMLFSERYIAANIGDSRLYHYANGKLTQITDDHSYVQMLIDHGSITAEQARFHPQRNIIMRAIGIDSLANADIFEHDWADGDMLLLCSDGLHGAVEEDEITAILANEETLAEKCAALVSAALLNGGRDNITVVLAHHTGGDAA